MNKRKTQKQARRAGRLGRTVAEKLKKVNAGVKANAVALTALLSTPKRDPFTEMKGKKVTAEVADSKVVAFTPPFTAHELEQIQTMAEFHANSDDGSDMLDLDAVELIADKAARMRPEEKAKVGLDALPEAHELLARIKPRTREQMEICGDPDSMPAETHGLVLKLDEAMGRVESGLDPQPMFLLYDVMTRGRRWTLLGAFGSLKEATEAAGDADRAIEEWAGSRHVRHHFRDSFGAWTHEDEPS